MMLLMLVSISMKICTGITRMNSLDKNIPSVRSVGVLIVDPFFQS